MISAIIQIAIGIFVWKYLPSLFRISSSVLRDVVNIMCVIIGIVMIVKAVLQLLNLSNIL